MKNKKRYLEMNEEKMNSNKNKRGKLYRIIKFILASKFATAIYMVIIISIVDEITHFTKMDNKSLLWIIFVILAALSLGVSYLVYKFYEWLEKDDNKKEN